MSSLPTLATPRLRLFVPSAGDHPRLVAFGRRNEAHFARFSPPPPDLSLDEAVARRIARAEPDWREDRGLLLVGVDCSDPGGPVLAEVQLSNVVRGVFQACLLGFKVDGACEGTGLMHEALARVIAFAFEEMRLHRIMANYQPANERSAQLLRRLGFVVEGYARDYLFIGGAWRDHVLTALVSAGGSSSAPHQ